MPPPPVTTTRPVAYGKIVSLWKESSTSCRMGSALSSYCNLCGCVSTSCGVVHPFHLRADLLSPWNSYRQPTLCRHPVGQSSTHECLHTNEQERDAEQEDKPSPKANCPQVGRDGKANHPATACTLRVGEFATPQVDEQMTATAVRP